MYECCTTLLQIFDIVLLVSLFTLVLYFPVVMWETGVSRELLVGRGLTTHESVPLRDA